MILEEQRVLHEDLERLEQGIADRVLEEPRHIRDRLSRDHQIANFVNRIHDQSQRLLQVYEDSDGARTREIQTISTGDPFDEFYKQLNSIKDFHRKYPNEPVENLERAYKRRAPGEDGAVLSEVDNMFTGEEGFGRFFDLTMLHEEYLNLPGVKGGRRLTYLQYLDMFDAFTPPQCSMKRSDKLTDAYFQYIRSLAEYLEGFFKRTKPLENHERLFQEFDDEFTRKWDKNDVPGWTDEPATPAPTGPVTEGTGEGVWCAECEKEFKNDNVYKAHLTGKKHIKAVEARKASGQNGTSDNAATNGTSNGTSSQAQRLKERAVAEREFRVKKLTSAMQTERGDTRTNVERKQGMTERERQQELAALMAEAEVPSGARENDGDGEDSDGEERIYNPLKLPLAWDGKPIPFWLYKLHGLGVEFPCEVCGNFVYMGRRAFDKHFNEARHTYGLKCLGITQTTLFREITSIEEALKLWNKIQNDKREEKKGTENVVEMEDQEGHVMPEKVYYDLQKQGLL